MYNRWKSLMGAKAWHRRCQTVKTTHYLNWVDRPMLSLTNSNPDPKLIEINKAKQGPRLMTSSTSKRLQDSSKWPTFVKPETVETPKRSIFNILRPLNSPNVSRSLDTSNTSRPLESSSNRTTASLINNMRAPLINHTRENMPGQSRYLVDSHNHTRLLSEAWKSSSSTNDGILHSRRILNSSQERFRNNRPNDGLNLSWEPKKNY
eukprot:GHVL01037374.1.p1 GENE.GHVL01037374.1~~GHVL01037374.1.p1  ORF type:complete len:206 (+),score=10.30 GHVL01037374.1:2251-2868(+)